jgi:hypothetical protein
MIQKQLTIAHWIAAALAQPVVYDEEADYKSHAVAMQDVAAGFLWDEAGRLESAKLDKLGLLQLAAVRGAVREVEGIYAGDCPRAWLEWRGKQG